MRPVQRPPRNDRQARNDRGDKPVVGLGDHVPAFLMATMPGSETNDDANDDEKKPRRRRKST